jgi:hypothetical protein
MWLNKSARSCCIAIVVAQALSTPHLTAVAPQARLWSDESIAETLMMPLMMVMGHILLEHDHTSAERN